MDSSPAGNNFKIKPPGVVIISALLIFSSLIHIQTLVFNFDWYRQNFGYLPEWLANLRYCFSWLQRILGITAGIGILYLNNQSRRLGILIGYFTIATLYWKHPLEAFETHTAFLDQKLGPLLSWMGKTDISFSSVALPAMIVHDVLDISFWLTVIIYLTRPGIKKYFTAQKV